MRGFPWATASHRPYGLVRRTRRGRIALEHVTADHSSFVVAGFIRPLGESSEGRMNPATTIAQGRALMLTTSPSLLDRLRQSPERQAWARFVDVYTPLLFAWAARLGLTGHDAADLVQDVFTILVEKLPEFRYDSDKSF